MPGGRRNAKSSSFNKHQTHASDDRHADLPTQPQVIPPKHIPIPDLPPSSDLYFEIDSLILCLFAMTGQYINLYRSVFWLPYSHTEYALTIAAVIKRRNNTVRSFFSAISSNKSRIGINHQLDSTQNYYLIDYYILAFNLVMIGRRLPVCILKQMCVFFLPSSYHSSCGFCIHIFTVVGLAPILLFCIYNVIVQHGTLTVLFLIYPFAVYLIVVDRSVTKFLELLWVAPEKATGARSKNSVKQNTSVVHVCSMSAETIREEVETLRSDCNARWKQVMFNSFLIVYHTTFLPCYFAQDELHYDISWATQHGVFTGISCFTLYVTHCFPPRYCDVLHRAALHLGRWQKVEVKNVHVPYSMWTESATWNQGALVKHSKELFKAEGISNAAEPGHSGHSKFYSIFKNPTAPTRIVFLLEILLVSSLTMMLCQSCTWNELLPIQLLILINCKTLYAITKVYFVVKKIYHEEKVLISKFCN